MGPARCVLAQCFSEVQSEECGRPDKILVKMPANVQVRPVTKTGKAKAKETKARQTKAKETKARKTMAASLLGWALLMLVSVTPAEQVRKKERGLS